MSTNRSKASPTLARTPHPALHSPKIHVLCTGCAKEVSAWQMVLLFALLGLLVALLVGQESLRKDSAAAINWSVLSSLIVILFGMGTIVCILTTPSPFV